MVIDRLLEQIFPFVADLKIKLKGLVMQRNKRMYFNLILDLFLPSLLPSGQEIEEIGHTMESQRADDSFRLLLRFFRSLL